MTYYTLQEAKRDHPNWFERGAMNFFHCQLDREYHAIAAVYLVYSNRFDEDAERHWHVTRFDREDSTMIGPIDGLGTKHRARVVAEALAAREKHGLIRRRDRSGHEFRPCPRCKAAGRVPGWATFEVRYPMLPSHPVQQWLDICSEHLVEVANVAKVAVS